MMKPLTAEEQHLAAENHDLVFAFLKEKELPIDVYYDVVIFGYLKAVQKYCARKKKIACKFSTIAWHWMESELSKHHKYLTCPKRSALVVSFDDEIDSRTGLSWGDVISIPDSIMLEFEKELLLHTLASELPPREMRIIRMKADGHRMNEIAKAEHLTFHAINKLLAGVYPTVIRVLWG